MNKQFIEPQITSLLKLLWDKTPEEAVKFLKSKGIEVSWNWQEQLALIEKNMFTVAKTMNADVVQMLKEQLEKALATGVPFSEFKKETSALLEQKGWTTRADGSAWRLETIFRTNLQSAYMTARYNRMQEVTKTHPYWKYIAIEDSRTSEICRALNGKILKADDPGWSVFYPPNHYNCRSRVQALNPRRVEGNTITKGSSVNAKPDKGFERRPGQEWKPDLSKYDKSIADQLKKDIK